MIWWILAGIGAACFALLSYLLIKGLKEGRDYDDRMHDIYNGKIKLRNGKFPEK